MSDSELEEPFTFQFSPKREQEEESEAEEIPEQSDTLKDKVQAEFFDEAEPVEHSSFTGMSLSRPILKAIAAMGYVNPTEIQQRAIPIALLGRDICGSATTGSGKTAAFIIPVLERLLFRPAKAQTRVLVLVPTRELGAQCHEVTTKLAQFTSIDACLCVGGLDQKHQQAMLSKKPDIVIATPGRLIDHIHNSKSFSLDDIEILIIDEADRMLDDGFQSELEEIIKNTPRKRQTMLFSATMTDNVDDLIKLSLNRPVRLQTDSSQAVAHKLSQEFVRVRIHREEGRPAMLVSLCKRVFTENVIVFFASKAKCHYMKLLFDLMDMPAAELHGNLKQAQRSESLANFKAGKVKFLLATDLASRGLDVTGVKTVINYEMPKTYAVYIHRVGRTARAGRHGCAVSLIGEKERPILKQAIQNARSSVKQRLIPAQVLQKFETEIEALKPKLEDIVQLEKQEKQIEKAEMEINRANNLIIHHDEIMSRPKKEWFKASNSSKESERKVANQPRGSQGIKRNPLDGLSRRKKRLREARKEDQAAMAKQKVSARHAKKMKMPSRISKAARK